MKKMNFIFFNIDISMDINGLIQIDRIFALETNGDFKTLSTFEFEVDKRIYNKSFIQMLSKFETWIKNPYEVKFISFEQKDVKLLIDESRKIGYKSKTKDFLKILNYQYWNVRNEMIYRMGLQQEDISLNDLLSVYGLSFIGKTYSAKEVCFNTLSLVFHFKNDTKRNRETFTKNARPKQEEIKTAGIPFINYVKSNGNGEDKLKEKMAEGWNISIECKAKGRGYGMTFEGIAYPIQVPLEDRFSFMRFGVGKTLEELIINMFDTPNPAYIE